MGNLVMRKICVKIWEVPLHLFLSVMGHIRKALRMVLASATLKAQKKGLRVKKHDWLARCLYNVAGWGVLSGVIRMMLQLKYEVGVPQEKYICIQVPIENLDH